MEKGNKIVGEILRAHREKAGMTQLELARKIGYDTPQFISLFERGLSKVPVKTIGKISAILKFSEKEICKILLDEHREFVISQINSGKSEAQGVGVQSE